MGKFLLGLIVALLIGVGVYYFMLMDASEQELEEEVQQGASLNVQANPIPQGAVMEDGTLD